MVLGSKCDFCIRIGVCFCIYASRLTSILSLSLSLMVFTKLSPEFTSSCLPPLPAIPPRKSNVDLDIETSQLAESEVAGHGKH